MLAAAEGRVLVIPDTCALLDIVRFSVGLMNGRSHLSPFERLVELQAAGGIDVAIPELVDVEFDANLDRVWRESVHSATEAIGRIEALVDGHGLLPGPSGALLGRPVLPSVDSEWANKYVESWVGVVRSVVRAARVVPTEEVDTMAAYRRSAAGRAPCPKRGEQSHDAVVVATALRVASETDLPVVFVSSNIRDFCNQDGTLHRDLVDDFRDAGLDFARSWGDVLGRVLNRLA